MLVAEIIGIVITRVAVVTITLPPKVYMTLKCSPTRVPHGSLTSVILAITMVVIKFLSIMGYIRILGGMCQQCASFLSGSVHSWQLSESSLGAGHQQY